MWLRGVRAEVTGLGVAAAILAMAAVFDVVEGADLLALAVLLMLGGSGLVAARVQVTTRTVSHLDGASADPAPSTDPAAAYDALLAEPAVREGSLSAAARALLEGAASAIPTDRIALYLATADREQFRMVGAVESGSAAYTPERMVARAELMPFETLLEAQTTGVVEDCEIKAPSGDRSARSIDDGACRHLAVPVVIEGRTDGFLWLARRDRGQPWSLPETLLAAAVSGLVADVIRRNERADTERAALKSRQALARQNAVMNELLRPGPVRDGELGDAMRELSRTLSIEAGIDRVAITVLGTKRDDVRYAEAYVAAEGSHQDVFTTAAVRPASMVHAARPEFMIVADDVRTSRALAPFYEGLLKVLDIRSFMQMPIEV
ncbi:MAG: GAF domain-containing protein, partial [Hyphomicrobiales bacterium]|nr:GAF domain-containing protein [Hyphomicrobiales bacterium]